MKGIFIVMSCCRCSNFVIFSPPGVAGEDEGAGGGAQHPGVATMIAAPLIPETIVGAPIATMIEISRL